ncbi:MAG: hypothetical protein NTX54_00625 [Chloroflexi bacterium]|nr:hypothetical protein [Chloroflexota bacterium]
MNANEHEYKVMGLAPHAKDEDAERVLARMRGIICPNLANPLVFRSRINTWDTLHFLDDQFHRTRFDHLAGAAKRLSMNSWSTRSTRLSPAQSSSPTEFS